MLSSGLAAGCGALQTQFPARIAIRRIDRRHAYIVRVGGGAYVTMDLANAAVSPGGVIEILPGTHVGSSVVATISKPIAIRGICTGSKVRPIIDLGTATVSKSILNSKADLILEGLTIRGARTPPDAGDNAAGFRPEPSCRRQIVLRCAFVDNQNGVLTPTVAAGAIHEFEDRLFEENGKGHAHSVYFGRADKVTFTRCTFQNSFAGHEVKSRSLEMVLDNCLILNTRDGRAIDHPNGGKLRVVNGTAVRKVASARHRELVGLSRESQMSDDRPSEFLFEDSNLDNQRSAGIVIYNDSRSGVTAVVRDCQMPGRATMVGPVSVS